MEILINLVFMSFPLVLGTVLSPDDPLPIGLMGLIVTLLVIDFAHDL